MRSWPPASLLIGAACALAPLSGCGPAATPAPDGGPPAASTPAAPAPARAPSPEEVDTADARAARERLVRRIELDGEPWEGSGPYDPRVLAAMRAVPRHLFMPGWGTRRAYADKPAPIGHGQTISQPTVVAIMSHALRLTGAERVLEIGTGSGYQAAVLSALAREVCSIEIVAPLGEAARARLARLGYANVDVRIGDGYAGWPERAPFDRILLTAAPPAIPKALVDQLAEGGVLVGPVGDDGAPQRLVRWTKRGGRLDKEDLGGVRFVPMVEGAGGG